jgi:hypothetical protein
MKVDLNHLAIIQLQLLHSFDIRISFEKQNGMQEGIELGGSLYRSNRLTRVGRKTDRTTISIANDSIDA